MPVSSSLCNYLDSAVLKIEDQVKIFGSVPTKHVEEFMEYMKIVDPSEILHTNAIHSIWPNYPHEIANVAGFFIIPLSKVNDYLVFFRKESVHVILDCSHS
jgi:light-regulated signal transduction histidine kinase (bacteriophytochrome)